MRPYLIMSFFYLSCGLTPNHTRSFLQAINTKRSDILIIPKNEMIPPRTTLIKYPYQGPSDSINLSKLLDVNKPYVIFFLGKDYVSQCDICLYDQISFIKDLSKSKDIPVLFLCDNTNGREMAIFHNRHKLNDFYLFSAGDRQLKQYDYTCFLTPAY
jgi:hypothetical protein